MCLPYFLYGLSSPSGGRRCCCDNCAKKDLPCCRRLRRLHLHRHHRHRCCFCCCCRAAAKLLLCCCRCHIRVPLLRVPKQICYASRCQPIFPFFDTRFVFFGDLNAISAIRSSQTQSKWCRNEFSLFQVRRNYWLNDSYRKHSNASPGIFVREWLFLLLAVNCCSAESTKTPIYSHSRHVELLFFCGVLRIAFPVRTPYG